MYFLRVNDRMMFHTTMQPRLAQKVWENYLSGMLPEKSVTKQGKQRGSLSFCIVANHIFLKSLGGEKYILQNSEISLAKCDHHSPILNEYDF